MTTARDIVTRVRRNIGDFAVGTDASVDANVIGSDTPVFSDEDILMRINMVIPYIMHTAKAMYLPIESQEHRSDLIVIKDEAIRILENRVFRDEIRCVRRPASTHRELESAKRMATPEYPVFTYEESLLRVYPTGGYVKYHYIPSPAPLELDDELPIPDIFNEAIVQGVSASCSSSKGLQVQWAGHTRLFEEEMQIYSRLVKHTTDDDREVAVEEHSV